MKKLLIALTIVISCLGISRVNAEENVINLKYVDFSHSYGSATGYYGINTYSYLKNAGYDDEIEHMYHLLIEKYNNEYKENYPFFFISASGTIYDENFDGNFDNKDINSVSMAIHLFSSIPTPTEIRPFPYSDFWLGYEYDVKTSTYKYFINEQEAATTFSFYSKDDSGNYVYKESYFVSNFDIVNPTFQNMTYVISDINLTIKPGDVIKPMFTIENAFQNNYTEINLNDYAYVALSLKNYNQKAFETTVQVKGQYCLTPVYNYGMTERKDILSGTQVDRCSPYYDNYTPIRTYILDNDLKNNAIYYLKSYDTSRDNYVKVDTSIFDITYITEEDRDNPYVTIGGKIYPTIPYDELTDTSTKSEDEDYTSGTSCAVGDFNCQVQHSSSFSDIFDAPLEFLEEIWDSIVSVFSLITELLSLLPPVIRDLLYLSFTLALIIGLIKIIL